ncbi:MAG TPA: hypothetical protein VET85_00395 [Stellaceae bacterium]|nr:hypothetical protein [Stellaceae bacterium]
MSEGILIDERGREWSDHSWEFARRIGYVHPGLDLGSYAVRECGCIHVRQQPHGLRIGLRAGAFGKAALAGALYLLKQENAQRILLAIFADGEWSHEVLTGVWEFAERAEVLAEDGPTLVRYPWLAEERNLKVLAMPNFSRFRPLIQLWESYRGRLPHDIEALVSRFGMMHRMVLARQRPKSSRLVFAHFGIGIEFMRPCQTFLVIDRDIADVPDREYGARTSRAYAECLAGHRPRLESIRATIRDSETTAIQTRYDRMLLPWAGPGNDLFVMGISLTRVMDRRSVELPRQVG